MNKCHFVGKLVDDPYLTETNSTYLVKFVLAVEDHRRDKHGAKKRRVDFLQFEAWDTAASTIEKYTEKGDFLVVEAIARQHRQTDDIVFRVTNFKIFPNTYPDSEWDDGK